MICENHFCIYWWENACILEEVTLDIQGTCQQCIYISIDDKDLQPLRNKMIEAYKNISILDTDT